MKKCKECDIQLDDDVYMDYCENCWNSLSLEEQGKILKEYYGFAGSEGI